MTGQVSEERARREASAATGGVALVYGYLFPVGGFGKWLGRQGGLPWALSEHLPVVVLERSERASSRGFGIEQPTIERIEKNLYIMRDAFSVRMSRFGKRVGGAGCAIDGGRMNRLLAAHGLGEYIYWLASADPRLLRGMRQDRLVYDCYDPAFDPESQAECDRNERLVAGKARVVFASAHTLLARMKGFQRHSYLLPNACSADSLNMGSASMARPAGLAGISTPIVGCMSTYDRRVDAEMLYEAALRLSKYTFALVGRVNGDQLERLERLRGLPNVIFPGQVSYEEGLAWSQAFDVGLIPFLPGATSDAVNPVKMYMYLAGGKPVVTTWISECAMMAPLVKACRTAEEFVAAIREGIEGGSGAKTEERRAFARKNRWEDRAREAIEVLISAQCLAESDVDMRAYAAHNNGKS